VLQRAVQTWSSWLRNVLLVCNDSAGVQSYTTVGPIPISDNLGKEVILRLQSSLHTAKTFYSDSEGMEMQKRVLNYRPTWNVSIAEPVAGNYYPVNGAAALRDTVADAQLSYVTAIPLFFFIITSSSDCCTACWWIGVAAERRWRTASSS
jgi:lysosomal alpha-mannosidase